MTRAALVLVLLSIPAPAFGQQAGPEAGPPGAPPTAEAAPPCNTPPTILPQPGAECPATKGRAAAIRVGRVAVEAVLGAAMGGVVGLLGAYGGLNVDLLTGHEAGAGLSTGLALGYTLGVAPGVWLGGRAMGGDGSFGWTLLGTAVGTGISAGLLAIDDKPAMLAFAATVPIATAIVAYELSSHLRRPKAEARSPVHAFIIPVLSPTSVGLAGVF